MKNIRALVWGTTLFLVVYTLAALSGVPYLAVYSLSLIGSLLFLYMVYAVLRYGEQTDKTFEDGYWYGDVNRRFLSESERESRPHA